MRIHPNPWQTLKYCDNVADIAIMQKGGVPNEVYDGRGWTERSGVEVKGHESTVCNLSVIQSMEIDIACCDIHD